MSALFFTISVDNLVEKNEYFFLKNSFDSFCGILHNFWALFKRPIASMHGIDNTKFMFDTSLSYDYSIAVSTNGSSSNAG